VLGTVALSIYSFCEPPKLVASLDLDLSIYSFCEPAELVASVDGESDGGTSADTIDPKLSLGSHQAKLADVSLHYVVAGHGPLVLVTSPGWGIGSLYLQRGLVPLEKTFTVVYLDTRGSGGSSRPTDTKQMSMAVMADDIDRFRSYLGLDSIKLMGHSNGGHRARLRRALPSAG
jgi:alpha/beta hydrolase fold